MRSSGSATAAGNTGRTGDDGEPGLAARLEAELAARLRAVHTLTGGSDGHGAAALVLDAHRQVFDSFVRSMTTYRPLLLRIRAAYDLVLCDAAASAHDHAHLRSELARAPAELAAGVEAARVAAEAEAAAMARELQEQLEAAEAETEQAERKAREAEDQLSHVQQGAAAARRELERLAAGARQAQAEMLAASSWARLAGPGLDTAAEQPATSTAA